jgi:hypothetical protein
MPLLAICGLTASSQPRTLYRSERPSRRNPQAVRIATSGRSVFSTATLLWHIATPVAGVVHWSRRLGIPPRGVAWLARMWAGAHFGYGQCRRKVACHSWNDPRGETRLAFRCRRYPRHRCDDQRHPDFASRFWGRSMAFSHTPSDRWQRIATATRPAPIASSFSSA